MDGDGPDRRVLERFSPAVAEWWRSRFGDYVEENDGYLTPPQEEAIPAILDRENTLICAPTGSGKTLASFAAIVDDLHRRALEDDLENTVYCLYVSPLKSLANDIKRNLTDPLEGIESIASAAGGNPQRVRHAIRHGDTSSADRAAMLEETPHILNTTPETLAILLNAPRFREKLTSVEYVIVDEIHALAESKRGTHLSVSLERLEALAETSPTRIGCSATIEPLETIARFLVGREGDEPRPCRIVDARFARTYDLELECPVDDLLGAHPETTSERFYERLAELVERHTTTLVFTNTRSGAERVLYNLRERHPDVYTEETSACHHGSLSKVARQDVERRLKAGELSVVTTSTSLELGIDMPTVDLVVQVGSPKSVAALLQRVGRAGHRVGQTVTGRVVALDHDELLECAVMCNRAAAGFVDAVSIPERCQDVAAQHVYGMAIASIRPAEEVRSILERAHPYRDYTDAEWHQLLRYLTAEHVGLEERNVYAKVWVDENDPPGGEHHYPEYDVGEELLGKRGRLARPIYMTNIGTIPDSFTCSVFTRADDEWVGQLDEDYLDTLEPGDVFVLGGGHFEYRYRRGSKVYVDPSSDRPTVPSWYSERLPLSVDLAEAILAFQGEALERYSSDGPAGLRGWLRTFPMDDRAVRAVARLIDHQVRFAGPESLSTTDRLVIEVERDHEEYVRHYYVHACFGRRVNDGLSRLLAHRCAQEATANVRVAVADAGFVLSMPLNRKIDLAGILADTDPETVRETLRTAVGDTDLLKRYFRINATRSLLILKRYKGYEKSASEQQVSSEMLLGYAEALEDFAVIEETYRELLEDRLRVDRIETIIGRIASGDLVIERHLVDTPTPRAYGLATLSATDVVLAEDESAVLREFHERVVAAIEEDAPG